MKAIEGAGQTKDNLRKPVRFAAENGAPYPYAPSPSDGAVRLDGTLCSCAGFIAASGQTTTLHTREQLSL
ncbi:hypothetical protein [Treponema endosymbiont of Eucomonympha sp.]|uniref:hypothetical protein n=1 Tax=Treponema endosymbiont of Eucomonympha sp. TaxID=1580831 RepID=UPI0007841A19|nr:hypothetical protein [Treponema endosymbiont of Eucomonympha sp.]